MGRRSNSGGFFYFMKLRSIDILLGSAMIKRACHCAHLVRMLLACMFARAFFTQTPGRGWLLRENEGDTEEMTPVRG